MIAAQVNADRKSLATQSAKSTNRMAKAVRVTVRARESMDSAAFSVGQARGVALLSAGMAGIRCFSYTPQEVKSAVCGTGRAGKDQVQRMVGALLNLPELPEPDHAADALAVAICHANGVATRTAVGLA